VLNKADLAGDVDGTLTQLSAIAAGVPAHAISARDHKGVEVLEPYFAGNRTVGLVGSSGVGKSTLTNKLLGRAAQTTQEVRAYDSRGPHRTTHRQLFSRSQGGAIIDTPAMRGLEVWNSDENTGSDFDDIGGWRAAANFTIAGMPASQAARCAPPSRAVTSPLSAWRFGSSAGVRRSAALGAPPQRADMLSGVIPPLYYGAPDGRFWDEAAPGVLMHRPAHHVCS
jgi:ethanolamine utilization protein EutP (predicted NTPase)